MKARWTFKGLLCHLFGHRPEPNVRNAPMVFCARCGVGVPAEEARA